MKSRWLIEKGAKDSTLQLFANVNNPANPFPDGKNSDRFGTDFTMLKNRLNSSFIIGGD
ncbi:hypothetical protein [Flavitalea sp.]|nr:hypothetical protein [Flavitalea sp.]